MAKRITWVDYIKGLSILMVVLGHIPCCPDFIKLFFQPFFLTTFLIASGYTYNNKNNFKSFCIKRVNTLLIPFFLLSFLLIISRYIFSFNNSGSLGEDIINMLCQIRGKGDDLWFISMMFVSSLLFYPISKLENKVLYFFTITALFIFSIIYSKAGLPPIPWHFQIVGSSIFYIGIGYSLKSLNLSILKSKKILVSSFLLYIVTVYFNCIILKNGSFSFYSYDTPMYMYILITILGLIWNISLCMSFNNNRLLDYFGKNTLVIFGLHGKIYKLFYVLIEKIIVYFGFSKIIFLNYFETIIIYMLTIIALIPIIYLINKYFPILSGKYSIIKYDTEVK